MVDKYLNNNTAATNSRSSIFMESPLISGYNIIYILINNIIYLNIIIIIKIL